MAKKQNKKVNGNSKVQTAVYLDRELVAEITAMGKEEFRSLSQMIAVLVNDAMAARRELVEAK